MAGIIGLPIKSKFEERVSSCENIPNFEEIKNQFIDQNYKYSYTKKIEKNNFSKKTSSNKIFPYDERKNNITNEDTIQDLNLTIRKSSSNSKSRNFDCQKTLKINPEINPNKESKVLINKSFKRKSVVNNIFSKKKYKRISPLINHHNITSKFYTILSYYI